VQTPLEEVAGKLPRSFAALGHRKFPSSTPYPHRSSSFSLLWLFIPGIGVPPQIAGHQAGDRGPSRRDAEPLGEAHQGRFDPVEAVVCHNLALEISRDMGNRWAEAQALSALGIALLDVGQQEDALAAWSRALALFEELGDPQQVVVRERLRTTTERR
jgi:tetratricopeptide (TPR) repeat protein